MALVLGVWTFLRVLLDSSASAVVTLENVALRHQLAVLQRSVGPGCKDGARVGSIKPIRFAFVLQSFSIRTLLANLRFAHTIKPCWRRRLPF